jgi:hypothetical protein
MIEMSKAEYSFTLNVDFKRNPRSVKIVIRPDELLRLIEGSAKALRNKKTLEFVYMPSKDNPDRWQALVREIPL